LQVRCWFIRCYNRTEIIITITTAIIVTIIIIISTVAATTSTTNVIIVTETPMVTNQDKVFPFACFLSASLVSRGSTNLSSRFQGVVEYMKSMQDGKV
jgi:hypothetical protein